MIYISTEKEDFIDKLVDVANFFYILHVHYL